MDAGQNPVGTEIREHLGLIPSKHAADPLASTPADVRLRRPIGEIFVELGFITQGQLEGALAAQKATGARIGEILVEQGILTRLDLASALAEHWESGQPAASVAGPSPGNGAPVTPLPEPRLVVGDDPPILALQPPLEPPLERAEDRVEPARPERRRWRRSVRADDALATEARLAAVEAAIRDVARPDTGAGDSAEQRRTDRPEALLARLELLESKLEALTAFERRVEVLAAATVELGAELHALTDRPLGAEPGQQISELERRVERIETEGRERIDRLAEELRVDVSRAPSAEWGGSRATVETTSLGGNRGVWRGRRGVERSGGRGACAARGDGDGRGAGDMLAEELRVDFQSRLAELASALGPRQEESSALRVETPSRGAPIEEPPAAHELAESNAVVTADLHTADRVPASEGEGFVAFAPTAAGYRLVELPGSPPELGSTLELDMCDGPLVVTRHGRSPLPFDRRPCAYLGCERGGGPDLRGDRACAVRSSLYTSNECLPIRGDMEASDTIQAERLGALLVEKNLITDEQLERALVIQEESGKRLGEILVAEFGVSRLEVAGVLSEQWAETEKPETRPSEPIEPLTPAEVHLRRPLGELLVMRGVITAEQLDAALEEQRKTGARIGEILVERGAVSRLDLAAALSEYGSPVGAQHSAGHVAGPQPSQDDSHGASPSGQGLSADGLALVADLEARLQILERAAGGAPWQEDLRLVAFDIRAAVSAVEARLEARSSSPAEAELVAALAAVSTRIDALENAPVSAELDALRRELEELKTRPVTTEGIAELRATVERLETLPDRADEIARLAGEVAVLAARSDEFGARVDEIVVPVAGLAPRIDGLSARVEEVAAAIPVVETDGLVARIELLEEGSRSGGGSLEQLAGEVAALAARFEQVPDAAGLSGRLEAVAEQAEFAQSGVAGLSGRVEELAARVPAGEVIEELRRELSELAARAGADGGAELGAAVASLGARLDEFGARVDEIVVPVAGLAPRIDGLSARVEEVAAAIPVVETDGLVARIELLEEGSRSGGGSLEQLAGEVAALAARFEQVPDAAGLSGRLEAVAEQAEFAQSGVAGLSGRVEELAARVPAGEVIEELRRELSELAARAGADGGAELGAAVASLGARLDEFGARVDEIVVPVAGLAPRIDGLSARVEEVAAAIPVVETDGLVARIELLEEGSRSGGGSLEQLAGEVAALAARFEQVPDAAGLSGRLEAVAEKAEFAQTGVAGLSGRVEELAARVPGGEVIEELRRELAGLAARAGADGGAELGAAVASLGARLDEFGARVDEIVVPVAGLAPRIDGLSARVEEVAAAIPVVETDGLGARIELLEEGSRSGGGTLEHLAAETNELRSQLQEDDHVRARGVGRAPRGACGRAGASDCLGAGHGAT